MSRGLLADKKDEELFVINKKPIQVNEEDTLGRHRSARKSAKNLEEKLNNLGCYRNLKPDPISAPAHLVRHRKSPDPDSRRQAKLSEASEKKVKTKKRFKTAGAHLPKPKKSKLSENKFDVCFETNPKSIEWNGTIDLTDNFNNIKLFF